MSKNGYFDDYEDNGLAPVDDNELGVAAEPEEDFDAFNSETFADGCEGGDEFWEEEHDKLIALDGDGKEIEPSEEFNGFKKPSDGRKLDQIDLRQLPDPMISQQASSLNVNNGHNNNSNSSYTTPNQGIENLLLAQFLMQQQQQRQHSPDIVAAKQQQQQQSILNTIQQQLNMPNQQSDQLNLQKLQLLQQQQQLQQILQQQQMQQKAAAAAAAASQFPPSASSSQSNISSTSSSQSNLNEIEMKLMQLFQLQQQLQQQISIQTAQQQKQQQQHAALLASGAMQQSTLVNAQIKQTGQLIQQLQMKNQMNNNQITQLIMMRNNLMNARTPVVQPNLNEILGNQEKENYLQSKLKELQINAVGTSSQQQQQQSSSSPSNMDALFKQSAAAAASAIYQQQLQKAAAMNPAILSMIQQQQQQQQSMAPSQPPLAPKALPNVKTLEELENELLNAASKPKTPPKMMDSNDIKTQQQLEMIKLLSNLNIAGNNNNNNNGSSSPSLIQQNQQSQDQQANMMLQKQILQAFLLQSQQNQGAQQQQQHQQQSQQQFALSNLSNQLKPNDQLMMLQQQQQLAARINNMLPPNFQHLTPQQKQLILSQRVQLLQQQIQQQQQQGNNNGLGSNNTNGQQTAASAIIENLQILEALQLMRVNIELQLGGESSKNEDDMMRVGHQQQQRNNNMGGYNNNNQQQNRNRRYNYNQNMMMMNRKPMHMYSYKGLWNDKLIGMMTDKEKNWVVNVQMLQLQIDDPYKLDFYYTVWMMKKKQFQNSSSTALKTSVLMQSNKQHDPKRTLTFENSLGRVTTSNFHHPRALIDINQKSSDTNQKLNSNLPTRIHGLEDENDDKSKEKKNICNILLEIEKMYEVYLTIDEIEHKILEEPEEIRSALFQDRRAKVDKLASMMCSENFPHYLFVAKGKRLLGKCISSFNVSQTKHILCFFMQYIYAIAKNNLSLDDVYSQVACAIDMHKFNDLVEIVEQFVHLYSKHSGQLFKTIFAHKFCLTYLLKFVSKSELINQDDYDVEVKTLWSSFINLVLGGLATIQPLTIESDGSVKWNIYEQCPLNVRSILDNFSVSNELWTLNERKLSELFILSSE